MTRFLLDLLLVAVFAAIGRLSHDESLSPSGWTHTAWPFLVGASAGWALLAVSSRARRRQGQRVGGSTLGAGLVVWVATVVVGLALRHLVGQGTASAFVVVAAVVLGLLLLGSRLVLRRP